MSNRQTLPTQCEGYTAPCGNTYDHEAIEIDGELVRVYGHGFPWNINLCPACLKKAEDAKAKIDEKTAYYLQPCPPSDWSPDDAGEHWGENDY